MNRLITAASRIGRKMLGRKMENQNGKKMVGKKIVRSAESKAERVFFLSNGA